MSNLSWWIYLTDLFGSLNSTLSILTNIFIIAFCISIGIMVICDGIIAIEQGDGDDLKAALKFSKTIAGYLWIPLVFWIFSAITPSQKTMYMILAAEAGQDILSEASPELEKVRSLINKKLEEFGGSIPEESEESEEDKKDG